MMTELTSFKINISEGDWEAFYEDSVLMSEALFNEAYLKSEEHGEVLIPL
ncbi:hypothetical protein [Terribacillus saccharophilus]|nr:hypothetical protein [Terribacillus saccharophilus]